jgi:delta-aminolevulinic acid dehydratase/porphobilinogen synthase
MHITSKEEIDQLPEPARSKMHHLYRLAEEANEMGLSFLMTYSLDDDIGTIGCLCKADPIDRMLKDMSQTLKRELGHDAQVIVVGKN